MARILWAVMLMAALAVPAVAGTVGGPVDDAGTLEVAYDMAWQERHYDFDGNNNGVSNLGYNNAEMRRLSHLGVITYAFSDMFEGKVMLGAEKLNAFEDETATNAARTANQRRASDRPSFCWGVGGKVTVPQVFANVDISISGQYQQAKFANVDFSDHQNDNPDYFDGDIKSRAWQANLVFSTDYEQFTPYLGLQYSDDQIDVEYRSKNTVNFPTSFTSNYEASHNWGVVVGTDIDFTGVIGGFIEGRFVDEGTAVSGGITYKF